MLAGFRAGATFPSVVSGAPLEAALPGPQFQLKRHGTAGFSRVWRSHLFSQPADFQRGAFWAPQGFIRGSSGHLRARNCQQDLPEGLAENRLRALSGEPSSPRTRPDRAGRRLIQPRSWRLWRGGRVVECTALEMRHTGNRIGGSNPSLSATPPDFSVLSRTFF